MRAISFIVLCIFLSACFPEKQEFKEEVAYEGATFGMEAFAQQTIETTLRHTDLYMQVGNSGKKYFQNRESSYFSYFPTDTAIITKINPALIDTASRDPNGYPPTQTSNTLYLSPAVFTEEEYKLTVEFLKKEYQKPDADNKILHWLNYSGAPAMDSLQWSTVYAVAYVDLATLQPTFTGIDENHRATILVNQSVDVAGDMEAGLQMRTSFFIRQDTLFYHEAELDLFKQAITYKNQSGKTLLDYCLSTKALTNMERFYIPPFQ